MTDVSPRPIVPFPVRPVNPMDVLEFYLQRLYTLNPVGVSMSTAKELFEMAIALREAAILYVSVTEDGKLDTNDLNPENIQQFLKLTQAVSDAVKIEGGFDFSTLDKDQIRELLASVIESVFMFLKVQPSGTTGATYKELKEITDLFTKLTRIFVKSTEDGVLTWTDLVANLGSLIDLTKAAELAAKIDGTIQINELTHAQGAELVSEIVTNIYTIVEASKKLR